MDCGSSGVQRWTGTQEAQPSTENPEVRVLARSCPSTLCVLEPESPGPWASVSCLTTRKESFFGGISAPGGSPILAGEALSLGASASQPRGPPDKSIIPRLRGTRAVGACAGQDKGAAGDAAKGTAAVWTLFRRVGSGREGGGPGGSLPDPRSCRHSLPPFLRVNPFPAPPPARLGLLNVFAETEAGAEPGAFVTERWASGRGGGGTGQTVSFDLVTRRQEE